MSVATLTPRTQTAPQQASADELITGDVFATLDSLGHAELEEGVIIEMPPPGYIHGLVEFELGRLLGNFVRQHQLGYIVGGETGFYVSRDPDTVRAVDVAFISNERMATAERHQPYLTVLPELIIEVMSPHDRWLRVAKKLDEYFAAGAVQVWIVEPSEQLVYLYSTPTQAVRLAVGETISDVPFLPGLAIPVADIFAVLPK